MTTTIFGYIFTNRIQTFKAANYISAAFFLCRPMMKHYNCHTFLNKFQDDISCALAMYSYMWDWLYKPALYLVLGLDNYDNLKLNYYDNTKDRFCLPLE